MRRHRSRLTVPPPGYLRHAHSIATPGITAGAGHRTDHSCRLRYTGGRLRGIAVNRLPEAAVGRSLGRLEFQLAVKANHSRSFDHRRRPDTLRTAIATALRVPTSTTSRLPRVMPV